MHSATMRRSRRDRLPPAASLPGPTALSGRGVADQPARVPSVPTEHPVRTPRFEMTVGAFLARQRAGALHEGPRAELVDGRAAPALHLSPSEAAALVTLTRNLVHAGVANLGVEVVQWAPLRLGPVDLVRAAVALLPGPAFVLRGRAGEEMEGPDGSAAAGIGGSHDPASALLVVETMTTASAQSQRLARYAAAGAREVWLLDVRRGWVESLRSPWRGEYRSRTLWYPGEAVPISALHTVSVEALVPP